MAHAAAPAPATVAEEAPKPVEPAPLAMAEPEPRVIQKLNLSTDVLFEFDSARLKDEGKKKLDELAQTAQGAEVSQVQIAGYADRIGSEKKQCPSGKCQQVDATCCDVLTELAWFDIVPDCTQFLEQLDMEEMHLTQVWLRRIARHARAVLYRLAAVCVAFDSETGYQHDARFGSLAELVGVVAADRSHDATVPTTLHEPEDTGTPLLDARDFPRLSDVAAPARLTPAVYHSPTSTNERECHGNENREPRETFVLDVTGPGPRRDGLRASGRGR